MGGQMGGQLGGQDLSSQYGGQENGQSQYSQLQDSSGGMGRMNGEGRQHVLGIGPVVPSVNKQPGAGKNTGMADGRKAGNERNDNEHKEQNGMKHDEHKEQNGMKHDEHKDQIGMKHDEHKGEEDHKKAMMKGGIGNEMQKPAASRGTNGRGYHSSHMNALHHMGKAAGKFIKLPVLSVLSLTC